jgi:hypothetical protein
MTTSWVTRSRTARLLVAAAAVGVFAMTGAPSAVAEPLAVCTSDVIDGVEVDYCVANPNSNIVTEVPGVNIGFEPSFTIGLGG